MAADLLRVWAVIAAFGTLLPAKGHWMPQWNDSSCEHMLHSFAEAASHMTLCALTFSRPVRVCERCLESHRRTVDAFRNITRLPKGSDCKDQLLFGDRLELVQAGNAFVTGTLWDGANCDKCYTMNSSGAMNLRLSVVEFEAQFNATALCLMNATKATHDPCQECKQKYLRLNSLYMNMTASDGALCMDVVDMMNSTWQEWGLQLGCRGVAAPSKLGYFLLAPVICILPLIFYTYLRISVGRQHAIISQQRRLAEQLAAMARSYSQMES